MSEGGAQTVRTVDDRMQYAVRQNLNLKNSRLDTCFLLFSVFELMEKRNLYITAKAELARTQLQYELKRRTVEFYKTGIFLMEDDDMLCYTSSYDPSGI